MKVVRNSTQLKEVLNGKPGVFQDSDGETAADVAAGVDGYSNGCFFRFVPQGEVAAGLAVIDEALGFEKTDEFARGELG